MAAPQPNVTERLWALLTPLQQAAVRAAFAQDEDDEAARCCQCRSILGPDNNHEDDEDTCARCLAKVPE